MAYQDCMPIVLKIVSYVGRLECRCGLSLANHVATENVVILGIKVDAGCSNVRMQEPECLCRVKLLSSCQKLRRKTRAKATLEVVEAVQGQDALGKLDNHRSCNSSIW
jgi:hypothetical protein